MKKMLVILITSLLVCGNLYAKVRINGIKLNHANKKSNEIALKYEGNLTENPDLMIRDSMIQVAIPNSVVWPKIEKKISLGDKKFDTTVMAYQYDKQLVRFRVILPYMVKGKESLISVTLKDGEILLNFPAGIKGERTAPKALTKIKTIKKEKKQVAKTADSYDESYLEKLLKEKEPEEIKTTKNVLKKEEKKQEVKEDKVSMALSGNEKLEGAKSSFSLTPYVMKFTLFLGGIILLFFGVVSLFKKGVLKKGKLGFLNDTKAVTVLNTTYIGPKKSLMMVKVHKQILLLGSDDKGIHFLTEINDVTGLIKDGEKSISGSNFDSSLEKAATVDKEFNLKEVVAPTEEKDNDDHLSKFLQNSGKKENVKLSDQIKNKVKGLKSLQ